MDIEPPAVEEPELEPDLLFQHPTNEIFNSKSVSYSGRDKFRNTNPIPSKQLRVHTTYDRTGYVDRNWNAFLPLFSDEYLRTESISQCPNPKAAWVLDVEADIADYFKQEISSVVLSKVVEHPPIFHQSEMGPPSGRSGKFIDTVYYFNDVSGSRRDTKIVAAVGDYKRNVIIPHLWYGQHIEDNSNQVALSKELRGLAVEYETPQVFCFDGDTLLILQFRASRPSKMADSSCPVDCWVDKVVHNPDDGFPLRASLYRMIVQGIRRAQSYGYPLPELGGLQSTSRAFWSGEPLWPLGGGKSSIQHPHGYYREVDENNGALAWKYPDGNWVVDQSGYKLWDSIAIWHSESSSGEDMDIYEAT